MKKKLYAVILMLTGFLSLPSVQAQSNVIPTYTPGGSMPTLTAFDALSPMPQISGPAWWYYVGLLTDDTKKQHSLQVEILQVSVDTANYGIGATGFSFTNSQGKADYLWNFYPDINSLLHYPIAPLSSTPAKKNDFSLSVNSSQLWNPSNAFSYQFAHDITDSAHKIGQIGAHYTLSSSGFSEVGHAYHNPQFVNYQFTVTLQDERGLLPEGSEGFVGQTYASSNKGVNTWEFAAPNMRVTSWSMTIIPIGKPTQLSPVQFPLHFQNNKVHERIWLDRQIINAASPFDFKKTLQNVVQEKINKAFTPRDQSPQSNAFYFGTWMSFCLNIQPFNHTCGAAVAIWQKGTPTNLMNSDLNARGGFMNIFTPDSNNRGFPIQVGNTLTERLSVNDHVEKNLPYQIINDPTSVFVSPLSHHVYAKTVSVIIKKHTLISSVFDALFTKNKPHQYTLQFEAISPQTENVMGAYDNGYFEGAATVYLCTQGTCQLAGTGFIEQMGYLTIPTL